MALLGLVLLWYIITNLYIITFFFQTEEDLVRLKERRCKLPYFMNIYIVCLTEMSYLF